MRCIELNDINHRIYSDIKKYSFICVVLNFATNDLLLDYFYNCIDINDVCSAYFTFIKLLHTDCNVIDIKIIIHYYSPIEEIHFYDALKRYNKKNVEFIKDEKMYTQEFRNSLVDKFETAKLNKA